MYRDIKTVPAPSGWTPEVKYIDKLIWSPKVPTEVRQRFEPKTKDQADARTASFLNDHVNLQGSFPTVKEQRRHIKIKKITEKTHPCCGAYGLFAAQTLQPRQLILDYLGVVEYDGYDPTSDYVLRYGSALSIDAAKYGNEARFCNDFRGVASGPNVCFLNYLDERTNHIRVGIFVLGNRKIKKGEELLVTYGKSFWTNRGMDMHAQYHSTR
ncbi:uncharacterized protein BYT42DRAFT_646994 [Radiomyces spectabilis]|uniref:uncharacterized protein n=1 Tax=Radiomyces spectabilis TaxID=64574 RepID=UPI002220224A|nr:uncharacterized protein BYT42DRAFT_646994 [Radiomyces spectabilis]KAI8373044.1 hypothetical protein BYT42DRAFT_646994 [Radiomyces spectabilis]